ncbi:MAG TPA: VanW family protein [Bacillota bacterium]
MLAVVFAAVVIGAALGGRLVTRPEPELGPAGALPACALAQASEQVRFGPLMERQLPWWQREPAELTAARARHRAPVFLAAFFSEFPASGPAEAHNVALAAGRLAGTVLREGEIFSFNRALGPYTVERGYRSGQSYAGGRIVESEGGGVCRVSSVLYNLAVFARLRVVERHPHSMPVPYLPPGRDAAVTVLGGKDLRLSAPTGPVVLWAAVVGDTLYMAAYGQQRPPAVRWRQQVLERRPFPTVRYVNPELRPGEERVVVAGAEGVVVRNWLEVRQPDGQTQRIELGTDRYAPLPRVIEVGPSAPQRARPR